MKKSKFGLCLALIYSLVLSIVAFSTACPKKDALRNAVEASYRLPATTNDLIAQITTARDRGIISLDQSKAFGEVLNQMALAETVYVQMVKGLQAAYDANNGKVDPGQLSDVKRYFDLEIIGPFLKILELTKVLSGDQTKMIVLAVAGVQLLLKTIGLGIGSNRLNALSVLLFAGPGLNLNWRIN